MQQPKLRQEPAEETNWLEEAANYADFLVLEEEDRYHGTDQNDARTWVKDVLEINDPSEMYETERSLAELLGIDLEEEVAA